ncbi:MAG: tetraacyldisaccharide 4'-kinase [Flavobacteriaceae bacterium]
MMRAPAFWWSPTPSLAARLLQPASLVYGLVARLRFDHSRPAKAQLPVICIGNPTAGGAGKTPTAIRIAETLKERGRKPVFLTRGYGGRLKGPVRVEPERHVSKDVGDEPLLLARHAPVIVSADRRAGAVLAARYGDIIVMDDGFQNPALAKDLSILVIDGVVGLGNGMVLPAGPLRLAAAPQFNAAQAALVIGEDRRNAGLEAASHGLPVLRGTLGGRVPRGLRDRKLIAFSGIGRPEKFFEMLAEKKLETVARIPFPDHHRFTVEEAQGLIAHAAREEAVLVTTEKDRLRLAGRRDGPLATLYANTVAYPVALELDGESAEKLKGLLDALLASGA